LTGIIIDPVEKTSAREGSIRAGRITLETLLRHAVGLAIGSVLDLTGALILIGVNRTIHFDPEPPARPRLHETTTLPWCLRIRRCAQEEHQKIAIITTDGSSLEQGTRYHDQWDSLETRKDAQGAIMLFDTEILKEQTITGPQARGPIAAIKVTGLPPDVGVNSNYTELLVLAGAFQLAHALNQDDPPKIESDALSVLKHAEKEAKMKAQRSRDSQTMGPLYRVIRKTRWNNKKIKNSHTKSNPENGGTKGGGKKRKANTFTSKEARIFATDIYADPGTDQAAEWRIETATQEGLKYNVNAEHILYVTADEFLEGLYEQGEFYWKQEGWPMRVHNTSHLRGHVPS
jgi:hypothetical protein